MKFTVFIFLLPYFGISQVMHQDDSSLYIATYNIFTFGLNKPSQTFNAAKVLSSGSFDLVAIQEVMDSNGELAVNQLLVYLKDSFNLEYKAVISNNIGQGFRAQERIAFLYDPKTVNPSSMDGNQFRMMEVQGGRSFVFTKWKSGDLTFVLGSGHLYYGDTKKKAETLVQRKMELQMVLDLFEDPKTQFGDEDLIFVGDFNRAAIVDDYKSVSYDTSLYFIPNIEFFDPALNSIPQVKKKHILNKGVPSDNPKLVSSTVANGNTYVYDMLICSKSLLDNFQVPRNAGVYNRNFGVIAYDELKGYGYIPEALQISSTNILKATYSDHRPVWIRLNYKIDN